MRNFKKILFLVLCLALMLTFIACGDDESSQSSSASESESASESGKNENAVTVKFDTQGGTQINDIVIEKGDNVPKPNDPEKVGYTFDGWYADGEKWSFVGYAVAKDITLTAKWVPVEYTITFAGNVEIAPVKYTIEDTVTLRNKNFSNYYVVDSWFEDEELTKPISQIEKGTYGDKTIYAKTTYLGFSPIRYGSTLSVFKCDPNATEIVIPSALKGESITGISEEAFRGCSKLTSVTIPNSVTEIGDRAFSGCTSLTSVAIGNGVTEIGSSAFGECSKLTSITIPDSVTEIGDYAFFLCSSLTSVAIGNSVTSIGDCAFYGCAKITSIEIPNGVTEIGEAAFSDCSSLTSLTIPNSVTEIGADAFSNCSSLEYYQSDNSLYLGNDQNPYLVLKRAKGQNTTPFTINENTRFIYDSAFSYYFDSFESIKIPNSVTQIGADAFNGCYLLTSIIIPDSVTEIGDRAFVDCTSLTSVTIPDSVTEIGADAFRNCSSLTIYCEATSQPSGWFDDWNNSNRPVYWYSESEPTESGNFWHYGTNGEIVIWE